MVKIAHCITVTLCEASASELYMVLQNFFAELKKKDGTDYKLIRVPLDHASCTGQVLSEQWLQIQYSKG